MSPHLTLLTNESEKPEAMEDRLSGGHLGPCQPSDIIRTSLVLPRTSCSLLGSQQRWGLFTNTPTALH